MPTAPFLAAVIAPQPQRDGPIVFRTNRRLLRMRRRAHAHSGRDASPADFRGLATALGESFDCQVAPDLAFCVEVSGLEPPTSTLRTFPQLTFEQPPNAKSQLNDGEP